MCNPVLRKMRARSFLHQVTLKVTVKPARKFRFRLWLAKELIRAAASVLGCRIEIKVVP